jgi:flagellin
MRINNNLMALNAHRFMTQANSKQSKSLEKLSSGLAINSAADNAAGLAISEKMRAQINGLDQAVSNAQDGISMIQTAEGALQETQNILQRMRELAVQSSNDTNTEGDRAEIQNEIDQLAQEITRISESTEFNTKTLLDGSLADQKLHIGANKDQDISVSIGAMDASALNVTGSTITYSGGSVTEVTGDASDVTVSMGTYAGDNASDISINTTGLTVDTTATYVAGSGSIAEAAGDALADGVTIEVGSYAGGDVEGVSFDTSGVSVDTVYTTTETNVSEATIDNEYSDLNITWTAGTDPDDDVTTAGTGTFAIDGTDGTDWTIDDNTDGIITLSHSSGDTFKYDATGLTSGVASDNFSFTESKEYSGDIVVGDTTFTVDTDGTASAATGTYAGLTVSVGGDFVTGTGTGEFDIAGQTEDSSTTTYGGSISVGGSTVTIDADGTGTVASGDYEGLEVNVTGTTADQTGTFSIEGRTSETTEGGAGIDVSTQTAASEAITVINNAINTVSEERSKLGAVQNRLDHTITNLSTTAENMTASESRIRDVDMAKEMMEYTKLGILQQASQAMLAQANVAPQGVLQLLQ